MDSEKSVVHPISQKSVSNSRQPVGRQPVRQQTTKPRPWMLGAKMTWLSEWMCGCMVDSLCALCINAFSLTVGSVVMRIGYVYVQFWTTQHRTTDSWHSFRHTSNASNKSLKENFLLASKANRPFFTSFIIVCMCWNCFNACIHTHIHNLGAAKDGGKYTGVKTTIRSLKKIFSTASGVRNTIYIQFNVDCMRWNRV